MLCLSGFELYCRWVPLEAYYYTILQDFQAHLSLNSSC